jgi:hypothetical protein
MRHSAKRSFVATHPKPLAALADRDSSASKNAARRPELSERFSRRRIERPLRELTSGLRRFETASAYSTGASHPGWRPPLQIEGRVASLQTAMLITCSWVNSARPSSPSSLPIPEFLAPPKGT